jgi:hypothetical protein
LKGEERARTSCWLLVALTIGIFGPLTSRRSLEKLSESELLEERAALSASSES